MIINIKVEITNEEEIKTFLGDREITDLESKRLIEHEYLNTMQLPFTSESYTEVEIAHTVWLISTKRGWLNEYGESTDDMVGLKEFDTKEEAVQWLRERDYPDDPTLFAPIEYAIGEDGTIILNYLI